MLLKTFNHRPHTENRLFFSWYQILELCELLYQETNDEKFIRLGLRWAQNYQVIQPMFAYAYGFEAKYTKDAQRRLQALATTLYLDRDSAFNSHFSQQVKRKAAPWMEKHNPFTRKPTRTNQTT